MSLLDLSFVVDSMATHSVTVRRFNADTYDTYGKAEARTYTEFTASMGLQPVTGEKLARLSDGTNTSDFITVYSTTEIRVGDRLTSSLGAFEVETLDLWDSYGGFFRATARKLDSSEPRS